VAVVAIGISLAAVLIAFGSLLYARRADARAGRAEQRELEARFEVTPLGGRSTGDGSTTYVYRVLNASNVPAHALRGWLVDEKTGEQTHEDPQGPGKTLLPGEPDDRPIRFL
jgi:hypothetical protein